MVPLESRNDMFAENGRGEYLPLPNDRVAIGQLVWRNQYRIHAAIFDGVFSYDSVNQDIIDATIAKNDVIMLFDTTTSPLSHGWWKITGNKEPDPKIPVQAYRLHDSAVDYKQKHMKKINDDLDLLKGGTSHNSNAIEYYARYALGVEPQLSEFANMEHMIPKKTGLVWNVFPEFYNGTWKETGVDD